MKLKYAAICLMIFLGSIVCAEDEHDSHGDHHHDHHGKNWEIGFSLSSVWLEEEDHTETAVGIHLHFVKSFSDKGIGSQFGYGLGIEAIFGEGEHFTPSISLTYYPTKNTAIIISPGYEFAKHIHHEEDFADHEEVDSDNGFQSYEESFSMHYEFVYFVELKEIHIGPVIGFSHNAEGESHFSFGIHIGY